MTIHRSLIGSLVFALEGLWHAILTELNLKLFLCAYLASLILSAWLSITAAEWTMILLSGGTFLAIELLNTAIERFTDAFDDHAKSQDDIHFEAIKATKDVAAGAALVCALTWMCVMGIVFHPYVIALLQR